MAENHQEAPMGFFDKLKKITTNLFTTYTEADEAFFEELEETLILSDFGMEIAVETVEKLREKVRREKLVSQEEVRAALRSIIVDTLNVGTTEVNVSTSPCVFLFIGVNGVGKTTSIGKMANLLRYGGKKCLLCAADTFRAAAADQLEIWSQRSKADLIRQHEGADPGAVLFDALQAAKARGVDVVLCDTAGRLHNKANLMAELAKLSKIIDRECPGAARETLLVLDATTGQNGLIQAKTFKEAAGLTGIILTKLDGTAKGGIAVAIAQELGVPVKFAGVGEGIDDLRPFDSEEYAEAII
jgi:fused signal recognition particle receptor